MRKAVVLGLLICVLILTTGVALFAATAAKVIVKEIITITVDKSKVRTDVPPISVQGQTLVPVRGVFNAFGADIQWYPVEKRVYIQDDTHVIQLKIGVAQANVNNVNVPLQVPAMIYRGRTMVPIRFIAETLGAVVNWNPDTQTITITTRARATLTPQPPSAAPPSTEPQPAPPTQAGPEDVTPDDNGGDQ